jgi:predicted dehydrogenase
MKELKTALIGVGGWGSNILRALTRIDSVRLTHVCDINPGRRGALSGQYPGIDFIEDPGLLVKSPDIDAVLIATPAPTHAGLAERFLGAGKAVFVEKPMTLSLKDAERLTKLSEKDGAPPLMVGHLLVHHPATKMISDIISRGEIGEIYYMYTKRLNLGVVRKDENVLWSLAPHDISIVLFLMGETPESIAVQGSAYLNKRVEDVAFMTLFFPGDRMAQIHVSWLDPHKERKAVVVGSKKMLVFDDMEANEKVRIYDKGAQVKATANFVESISIRHGDISIPLVPTQEPLMVEIRHFVDCVMNKKRPISDARQGLEVVRVLTAGDKSMHQGGKTIRMK